MPSLVISPVMRGRCTGGSLPRRAGFDAITLVSDDAGLFCHRRFQRPSRPSRARKAGLTPRLGVRADRTGRAAQVVAPFHGGEVGYDRPVPTTDPRAPTP